MTINLALAGEASVDSLSIDFVDDAVGIDDTGLGSILIEDGKFDPINLTLSLSRLPEYLAVLQHGQPPALTLTARHSAVGSVAYDIVSLTFKAGSA